MAKNTLKTDTAREDPSAEKPQPSKQKNKTNTKTNSSQRKSSFFHKLAGHRAIIIYGIFFCFFSVFLLLAFLSFFHANVQIPEAVSSHTLFEILFGEEPSINLMGRIGAFFAKLFIVNMFGIAAFGFILLSFLLGTHLIKRDVLPFRKTILLTLIIMLWVSFAIGYILNVANTTLYQEWSGTFGVVLSLKSIELLGAIGVGLSIAFFLAIILYAGFNVRLHHLKLNRATNGIKSAVKTENDTITESLSAEQKTHRTSLWNIFRRSKKADSRTRENALETEKATEQTFVQTNPTIVPEEPLDQEESLTEEEEESALHFELRQSPSTSQTRDLSDVEFTIEMPQNNLSPVSEDSEIDPETDPPIEHYTIDMPYDPKLELANFKLPDPEFLIDYEERNREVAPDELLKNKDRIVATLKNYSIDIVRISATPGPTVTLYEIVPAPGIRISKIKNLEDDIALSLAALGIRIIAPIPGKGTVGIEVPNEFPQVVSMKTMILSEKFRQSKFELPIAIGKTISNEPFIADLTKMPHLLMAGATGQGKSVGLNAIITSLLYRKHPAELKFVMVDPKKVELSLYTRIERHYLAKLPDSEEAIITDTRKVVRTLNSLCIEMDQRYDLLKDAQVKNIKEYNPKFVARRLNPEQGHRYLPYIVLVIDEFADLIMTAGKEVETPIARLAQLARAIGIHLIIATQRPSVNIITGIIKANFPARIAFRVTSKIDSRTILDSGGAEQLIGRGDMLLSTGNELVRLQCALVDTEEIDLIADFVGKQHGYSEIFPLPEYLDENSEPSKEFDPNQIDEKFEEAARIIVNSQHGSTSLLQRKLQLGYNRAGRVIDQLEAAGIVGPPEGSKARDVLIKSEMELEEVLREYRNRSR